MEVDGVRPSSFHGHSGSACKAHSSGSPLAALLAAVLSRSQGQRARRAGSALGSLFLFPTPAQDWGANESWVGGHPPVLEPQKGAGYLALYPLRYLPWASVSPPGQRGQR